jgi:serine/threonine protein phosphatase PrpC
MRISTGTAAGTRYHQEDRLCVAKHNGAVLLAVMDGHGGEGAADLVLENIKTSFERARAGSHGILKALQATFSDLHSRTKDERSGSTLSTAYIPRRAKAVYVAVLGDSPVAIKNPGQPTWSSPEHNARTNTEERQEAEKRGAVFANGYLFDRHMQHGLQLSRALGDSSLGFLNRKAETFKVPIGPGAIVMLATDGVYDGNAHTSVPVIERLMGMAEEGADAGALVDDAASIRRTGDNVTVILCKL